MGSLSSCRWCLDRAGGAPTCGSILPCFYVLLHCVENLVHETGYLWDEFGAVVVQEDGCFEPLLCGIAHLLDP